MHSAANSRKSIDGSQPSNVILSFFPGIPSASALQKLSPNYSEQTCRGLIIQANKLFVLASDYRNPPCLIAVFTTYASPAIARQFGRYSKLLQTFRFASRHRLCPVDKPANIQVTTSAPVSRSFNA